MATDMQTQSLKEILEVVKNVMRFLDLPEPVFDNIGYSYLDKYAIDILERVKVIQENLTGNLNYVKEASGYDSFSQKLTEILSRVKIIQHRMGINEIEFENNGYDSQARHLNEILFRCCLIASAPKLKEVVQLGSQIAGNVRITDTFSPDVQVSDLLNIVKTIENQVNVTRDAFNVLDKGQYAFQVSEIFGRVKRICKRLGISEPVIPNSGYNLSMKQYLQIDKINDALVNIQNSMQSGGNSITRSAKYKFTKYLRKNNFMKHNKL